MSDSAEFNRAVLAALRDMAEKAMEDVVTTQKEQIGQEWGEPRFADREYRTPKYSREWIAGRLLGMADTLQTFAKT